MGVVTEGIVLVSKFLHGMTVPTMNISLIILGIYGLHLIISAAVLYYSVKFAGGGLDFFTGFPKALFTIFIRDLIAIPLIFLAFAVPYIGIILALVVWFGLVKYIFNLSWLKTLLAFAISLVLPVIVALFILIPLALLLL